MPKEVRHNEILKLLKTERTKVVTVKQICQKCYISESSARRDLKILEEEGLIKRFHGGAKLIEYEAVSNIDKNDVQITVKYQKIVEEAVREVEKCKTIFLDADSLTGFMIPLLAEFNQLTVITNGINNILALTQFPKIQTVFIGGYVSKTSLSTNGYFAWDFIDNFYVDAAFISCHAYDTNIGATEVSEEQMLLKKKVISQSKKTILLCESSKIGKNSPFVVCKPNIPEFLITDSSISPKEADKMVQNRISFRCV